MVYDKQPLDYYKTLFIKSYNDQLLYEGLQSFAMPYHINIHRRNVITVIRNKDEHAIHWLPKRKV